ncbi:MAG: DUF721 domain-containing protein [Candidatus Omnitrophica bacterium]|nr:DUF721 domain-containing protein [Candidatus Omnitrophota bacterium]
MKRTYKATPESISDILKKVVEKLDPEKKNRAAKLLSAWRSVAGSELAQHTRPGGMKKNCLLVIVEDSAWFYQANLKKNKILQALQKKKGFEKIEKIHFRIGKT